MFFFHKNFSWSVIPEAFQNYFSRYHTSFITGAGINPSFCAFSYKYILVFQGNWRRRFWHRKLLKPLNIWRAMPSDWTRVNALKTTFLYKRSENSTSDDVDWFMYSQLLRSLVTESRQNKLWEKWVWTPGSPLLFPTVLATAPQNHCLGRNYL